jgi:NAD(P)-dependent dehydrogenase (short-subunit alcohol dehydrogenase family)
MQIEGKVALVTGAASGIGRASALALAAAGAKVLVVDVDETGGAESVGLIQAAGGAAAFFRADVSSPADAAAMAAEAESRFGGLDILHNNAGLIYGGGFVNTPLETTLRMIEVNFIGVVLGTHAALPALQRRGGGAIVNTASIAGVITYPGGPTYAATKAGVVGFTRALTRLKDSMGIRVNCICPEVVDTPPIRAGRERARAAGAWTAHNDLPAIPVEEVAAAVLRLVRDDSLNGQALKISPGMPPSILDFPNWGVVRE